MDQQNIPEQLSQQDTPVPKSHLSFSLPLIICATVFLLIGVVGGFYLMSKKKNSPQIIPITSPTTTTTTAAKLPSSNSNQNSTWESYQSTIGISFLKPIDTSVIEPQLTADLHIESNTNKRENHEIIDGWTIGILYSPNESAPNLIKDSAEDSKSSYEKDGCTTTPIVTTSIGGKNAYYFYVTNCLHFSSSHYFMQSDSTYYSINAEYIGNIEGYKEVADRIITSITFTK